MKYRKRLKFPCGYEYQVEIDSFFNSIEEGLPEDKCPLHGKNCPREKKQ